MGVYPPLTCEVGGTILIARFTGLDTSAIFLLILIEDAISRQKQLELTLSDIRSCLSKLKIQCPLLEFKRT